MSLAEIIALIEPLAADEKRRVLNIVRIAIDTLEEEKNGDLRLIRSAQIAVSQSEADRIAAKIKQNLHEAEKFISVWKDTEEKAKQREMEEKAKQREMEEKAKQREMEEKTKQREMEEKAKQQEMEEKAKQQEMEAAKEKSEAARLVKERIKAISIEAKCHEAIRLESIRINAENEKMARMEAERLEADKLEAERLEAEQAEAEAERILAEEKAKQQEMEAERLEDAKFEEEFKDILKKAEALKQTREQKRKLEQPDNNGPLQKKPLLEFNQLIIPRPRNYIRQNSSFRSDVFYTFWKMHNKKSNFQCIVDRDGKPGGWFESKTANPHISYFKVKPEYEHTHQYNSKTKEWVHYYEREMRIVKNADMYAQLCIFYRPRF